MVTHDHPIRKKMARWEVPGGVRFITFSCFKRLPLLSNARIADLFADVMRETLSLNAVDLVAWVIMPEHVHLLVITSSHAPLDKPLSLMKQRVAQRVIGAWRSDVENTAAAAVLSRVRDDRGHHRFWQRGGGFDRSVRDRTEFLKTIRYIHRNPVEREFVDDPAEWRWSSVRWWMGQRVGEVPCDVPEDLKEWKGFA